MPAERQKVCSIFVGHFTSCIIGTARNAASRTWCGRKWLMLMTSQPLRCASSQTPSFRLSNHWASWRLPALLLPAAHGVHRSHLHRWLLPGRTESVLTCARILADHVHQRLRMLQDDWQPMSAPGGQDTLHAGARPVYKHHEDRAGSGGSAHQGSRAATCRRCSLLWPSSRRPR